MTTTNHHWEEKNRIRRCGALLNDINAKLTYLIQLVREERSSGMSQPPAEGSEDALDYPTPE
jgi:hypothetical protein